MFYILVLSGIGFFAFGVAATLINSYNMQKEYEMLTTELVRTDSTLKELEVKYDRSQNELRAFKLRIEASRTWTDEDLNETHGELEKLKAEYVRVKVKASNGNDPYAKELKEKCKNLLIETEEYNKLLDERNKELVNLRMTFDNMRSMLEENQKALKDAHERLKSFQPTEDTQDKIKEMVAKLEKLDASGQKAIETTADGVPDAAEKSGEKKGPAAEAETADKTERPLDDEADAKEQLDTMRSFLSSLDKD
nr:hypothetical protein 3 [bacterium]